MGRPAPVPLAGPAANMDRFEKAVQPMFGLIATLLMWWFLGDVLDEFDDAFFAVIAFGAALVFTLAWAYDLLALLSGERSDSASDG